jgi:FkbM family methyltransferase
MSLTAVLYQFLLKIYLVSPCKRLICHVIRWSGIPTGLFYRDVKFKGTFSLKVGNHPIRLYHHGGTIENELFWNGLKNWERDTVWLWLILASKAEVIFDVGANTGVYSLTSKAVNPKANVFAFEPSENVYDKLIKNILLNRFDILAYPIALSNFSGHQTFYDIKSENPTSATLSSEMMKHVEGAYSYSVVTKTMDDFIQENNITRLDLMKVDVEMHEPEFMQGFRMIQALRPILFIEILTDEVAAKLNEQLRGFDMLFFELQYHKIKLIDQLTKGRPYFWNFLVVPIERINEVNSFILR